MRASAGYEEIIAFSFVQNCWDDICEHIPPALLARLTNGDNSFLASLPHTRHDSQTEVHLGHVELDQFADAKPGGIEDFKHRPIPASQWRVRIRSLEQLLHFLLVQKSRQRFERSRSLEMFSGI